MVLSATLSNHDSHLDRLSNLRTTPILSQRIRGPKARKPLQHLNPDEVQELVARYRAGETMVELGERYGINRRAVSIHLQQSGIPSRHRTMDEQKVDRCIELYAAGLSLVAVGQELGIDQATVRRALLSNGISRRPRPGSSPVSNGAGLIPEAG